MEVLLVSVAIFVLPWFSGFPKKMCLMFDVDVDFEVMLLFNRLNPSEG